MEDRRRHVTPSGEPRVGRARWLACLLLALGAALTLSSQAAFADTQAEEAARLFAAGQYDAAERLFNVALEADADDAQARLGLAQVHLRKGAYAEAAALLDALLEVEAVAVEAHALRAELAIIQGDHARARALYEAALEEAPDDLRAMAGLGELLYRVGKHREGSVAMNAFIALFNSGKADTAEALTYVGVATRALEYYQDANDVLNDAIEADPRYAPAYLELAALYAEKYNQRDADVMYRKVLELDPNHPEAHVGLARVYLESDFDFDRAGEALDAALAVNPHLVSAHNVRAGMHLTNEDIDAALAEIALALAVNPNHLESLALKATAHYLADDEEAVERVERQILALNPRYADLYATMARYGEIAHRYEEGITLYEKALEVNPNYWKAYVGLGIAYTRVGDDEKGYEYLEKAFFNDPFNVRAYNMVELYDKSLRHYDFVAISDDVRVRLHRDEKDLLSLYVPPLIEGAVDFYSRKYEHTPAAPLSVEIFRDPTSFSVRSVGLPSISPQGICFGKVITARSPSEGNFNWAQVLWHELAHVYHIQISDSRVPRWFTEGLAEFETVLARREWQREHEIELHLALKRDELLGIADLNDGFLHAPSIGHIVVAYYQSTLIIEYIDETYGFDKLLAMLRGWGEHRSTEQIFDEVLGVDYAAFDAGFKAWLTQRLSFLDASYELDLNSYVFEGDRYLEQAQSSPDDARALADAGFVQLFRRDFNAARELLNEALAIDPNAAHANHLGGVIALREGDYEKARRFYDALRAQGVDGYTIRSEMGFLHLKLNQPDQAIAHYEAAKRFYPRGEEPYRELAQLYIDRGDTENAREQLETLVEINQDDFASASLLVQLAVDAAEWRDAVRYGRIAVEVRPFDEQIHLLLGRAAIEREDWMLAEREYLAYLELAPTAPLPGYLGAARAYVGSGQKVRARDYLERARAVAPDDAEVTRLAERINAM